ncbi:hypothetical protein K439DRAFT_1622106 [Ramaria rubella]|nr:hypothetical protein K439DRAFT_1622106 [Ramaria rubella]
MYTIQPDSPAGLRKLDLDSGLKSLLGNKGWSGDVGDAKQKDLLAGAFRSVRLPPPADGASTTVRVCGLCTLFALLLFPLRSDVDVMAMDRGTPSEGYRRKEGRKWDLQKISTGEGHPSSLTPDLAAIPATILGVPLPAINL